MSNQSRIYGQHGPLLRASRHRLPAMFCLWIVANAYVLFSVFRVLMHLRLPRFVVAIHHMLINLVVT